MAIKRMDHVTLVVEDLTAAIAFFTTLGMLVVGETQVEGEIVDRLCGLDGIKANIAMMKTPDGNGQIELTKYLSPAMEPSHPAVAPPNTAGLRQIMFAVDNIEETLSHLTQGADLIGEVVQYEDKYKLCYLRGPAGSIIALAEELS